MSGLSSVPRRGAVTFGGHAQEVRDLIRLAAVAGPETEAFDDDLEGGWRDLHERGLLRSVMHMRASTRRDPRVTREGQRFLADGYKRVAAGDFAPSPVREGGEGRRRNIADELRGVLDAEDGRTVEEMRAAEPSYTFTVERIDSRDETHTYVYIDGSMCGGFNRPDIAEGDQITVWDGRDRPLLGGGRHGWALNGEVIEWQTPFERVAKRVAWLADHDRRQREEFAERRAQIDADYDALPGPLKRRIDRFRGESPTFRVESEHYELFCCTEAVRIADALRSEVEAGEDVTEVMERFRQLSYEQQNERVPTLDGGHSGNTFGGAMMLAAGLLRGREEL